MIGLRRFLLAILVFAPLLFLVSGSRRVPPGNPRAAEGDEFERWRWAFEQRAYPLGHIPEDALTNAMEEMRRADALRFRAGPAAAAALRWNSIGPAPMSGGQIGSTIVSRPMSGRVNAVAVDPSDANHWLVGGDTGGIWETRDAGAAWIPRTDSQASLASGAIAFAPSDSRIVYAVTGAELFTAYAYGGAGLLKSVDGGASWQLLATAALGNLTCGAARVDPSNANTLLAATSYGFAGRGSEFPTFPARGILRSTDGGVSWSARLVGDATALQADSTNFSRQYAGLGNVFGAAANGVYRSADAGVSWSKVDGPWSTLAGGVGRVTIAIAPSNPNVLYVAISDALDGKGVDGGLLGLWQTGNPWATAPAWTAIPVAATDDGSGTHGYCGWDRAYNQASPLCTSSGVLTVDPANPSVLYAGGVPLWRFDGASWNEVSKTVSDPANGIKVDQRGFAWAGSRLIIGNDGGVWSTTDAGNTWSGHNTGLATHEVYGGSLHPTNPNVAILGSQDNGTSRYNGSAWTLFFGGDGSDSAISSAKPDTDWAMSAQNLEIWRTRDGGATRIRADAGIDKTGVPFIARLAKCQSADTAFIAGTDNLWKSANFFSAAAPSFSSNGPEMGSGISALSFAPSDASCATYAFGTASGQLRLTRDGGASWTDLDPADQVPNRFVTGLAFRPGDANALYVTLSGFDEGTPGKPGHVFRSANALSPSPSWSNVTPPVNIPHNAIAIDPANSGVAYVGTDIGLWSTADGGSSWTHAGPSDGMPNVPVFDLKVDSSGRAVAFTYGRGVFASSSPCSAGATAFCAGTASRFKVQVAWTTSDGKSGAGQAVALTSDTGYFWFFSPNNVEMVIKVVDGRALNGKFWVFAAGLTNVNAVITVTDTSTGAVRTYTNPQGVAFLPIQDTSAFATTPEEESKVQSPMSKVEESERSGGPSGVHRKDLGPWTLDLGPAPASAACSPDATTLCLNNGRFQVRTAWTTAQGQSGAGQAVALTGDTGYFWFFSSNNVEMVVKVVAGCPLNDRYWVFAGGLTNVNVVMTVTDTQTGAVKTYINPQGTAFAPIQDTAAFTCP